MTHANYRRKSNIEFPLFSGLNFAVYTFPIIALAIIGSLYLNDAASRAISRC